MSGKKCFIGTEEKEPDVKSKTYTQARMEEEGRRENLRKIINLAKRLGTLPKQ